MSFPQVVTRVWLVAAVGIWALSATVLGAAPLHAFQGITVPLAVLAVQGVQRLRLHRLPAARVWLALAVGAVTVPATAHALRFSAEVAKPTAGNGNFIRPADQRALDYLARDPQRGGVFSAAYLGTLVPGMTGRQSFMGDCLWTEPNCGQRSNATANLEAGRLSPAMARALVRASGARFVLTDCQLGTDITRTLRPMLASVHRFGCAAVYEVRPAAPGSPALAESALDAALRASGRQ
jgi:hypothetical protein